MLDGRIGHHLNNNAGGGKREEETEIFGDGDLGFCHFIPENPHVSSPRNANEVSTQSV